MSYFNEMRQAFIIAEIGVNHNGDINLAKKLIEAAKKSGADAVKFQTFSAKRLAAASTPKVLYQESNTPSSESHLEMLERLELSMEQHIELARYCRNIGIEFLSTPYDIESANFLDSMGVRLFKTASADLVDLPLHRFIAATGKPTIIATGMSNLGEIERVVNIYNDANNSEIILLHCVSNYPCSDESLNMMSMNTLGSAFDLPVGYSDHSQGFLASVIAVSQGAKVIEKHFTLDKNMIGPDHRASSTPSEFLELVHNIKRAEKMLGKKRKAPQIEEEQMLAVSRKSIVLARSLKAGDILTMDDFRLQRPGSGLNPSYMEILTGMALRHDLPEGSRLGWGDVEGLI